MQPCNVESRQPCWTCKKACGGCSWTEVGPDGRVRFEPISGWDAEKTVRRSNGQSIMESYRIKKCPEYEPDKPRAEHSVSHTQRVRGLTLAHLTNRQIALLLDISMADVRKMQTILRREKML